MKDKVVLKRTVGPASARFIDSLQREGKVIFTIDDALAIYSKDRNTTIQILSDLTKRGVLARIKSGVFLILQAGQEKTQLSNWPLIANALTGSNRYYLSYYSAMRLHGMTTHSLLNVYISMSKRCRMKKISDLTYNFIYVKQENFWGYVAHWATRQDKIYVSDVERTILDGLERPELCGGIKEVVRGIWAKHKEIDMEKMAAYTTIFHTKAAVKRLGFILETFAIGDSIISLLAESIIFSQDFVLFDPNGEHIGRYLSRWRLRINMNAEELKASVWE